VWFLLASDHDCEIRFHKLLKKPREPQYGAEKPTQKAHDPSPGRSFFNSLLKCKTDNPAKY